MFDRIPDLKAEIRHYKDYSEKLERVITELRGRIKLLESGARCNGKWCGHCEFHGGDTLDFENGVIKNIRPVCLKAVPCPDFVRKGGPKPHD